MKRRELEAEFHRRITRHITKRQQGLVMGEFRAVLDEADAQRTARAADVQASLDENHARVYDNSDGE